GLIDIVKMTALGLFISIVSKRVGNNIDEIIGELTLYKSKVNQLSQAVENSPVTIVIADLAGNILYANNKFVEVTGYNKEEVIGQNPRILKSGHTSDAEYKLLWESITQGKSWKGEFQNKHKNGSFYWESAAIYPIKNGQDEVVQFLAIKEDITEQKKVNAKLKNIAWQQSHEIRGPLTSIMGIIGGD
ncbi:MAG: PAS domain S-box protein, partial [Sediminibacterium sp.]|nr:PAS domain S-box protein [Sediminibacterium sp.]